MSPLDSRALLAAQEVERDWRQVCRHLADAQSVAPEAGRPEAAFVALALDHAYQAFESVLLRVERGLALPARQGSDWHRALLADAAQAVEGLRPRLVPPQVEGDWATLLGFRHFLRHAYAAELDPAHLGALVAHLEAAVSATDPVVRAMVTALRIL